MKSRPQYEREAVALSVDSGRTVVWRQRGADYEIFRITAKGPVLIKRTGSPSALVACIKKATTTTPRKNPVEKCPTCGRGADTPFRTYDQSGKIVSGCVDDFHTGHLVSPGNSSFWHNRPEAKKMRAAAKARRKELLRRNPAERTGEAEARRLVENFTGRPVNPDEYELVPTPARARALAQIGKISAIEYIAFRDDKEYRFRHEFKARSRPALAVSPDGKTVTMIGGSWKFGEDGFEDE